MSKQPILEGYLHKEGGSTFKNWKRRMFVLYPEQLIYKKNDAIMGTLLPKSIQDVQKVDTMVGAPTKYNMFGFTFSGRDIKASETRVYKVCAENAQERDLWVQELKRLIETLKQPTPATPKPVEEEEPESEESSASESSEESEESDESDEEEPPPPPPPATPPRTPQGSKTPVMDFTPIETPKEESKASKLKFALEPLIIEQPVLEKAKTPHTPVKTPVKILEAIEKQKQDEELTIQDSVQLLDSPNFERRASTDSSTDHSHEPEDEQEQIQEKEIEIFHEEDAAVVEDETFKDADRIEKEFLFSQEEITKLLEEEKRIRRLDEIRNIISNKRQKGELRIKMKRDNLNLGTKTHIKQLLDRNGEVEVIWSAAIKEINPKGKGIDKSFFLTRRALYLTEGNAIKKRFSFNDLESILVNAYGDESNTLSLMLPTQPTDFLFTCEHKQEFLEHLQDAYEADESTTTKFTIHTVDDVKLFTRRTKTDKKPPPMPIREEEIVKGGDKDYLAIVSNSEWRLKLRKYGDRFVHFSEVSTIGKKEVFIITDRAIYEAEETTIKRRVDLLDITELVVDNSVGNTTSLLIKIPSEYDILIDSNNNRMQIVDILQQVHEALITNSAQRGRSYEDIEPLVVSSAENVKSQGQFKKTKEYNEKIARLRNPEVVKKQMKNAVVSKSLAEIEKAMDAARKLDMETDKFYMLCQNETKKIKQAAEVRDLLQTAIDEENLPEMKVLLTKAETLKPHLTEFIRKVMPQYIKKINTRLFVKKIQAVIDSRQTQRIKEIFQEASRAGLEDVVLKQKQEYDKELQKENVRKMLKSCIEEHDSDGIRLVLITARSLDIHTETEFQDAHDKFLVPFLKESQAFRSLNKAVTIANRTGNVGLIKSTVENVLTMNLEKLGPESAAIVQAREEIILAKRRAAARADIRLAINHKEAVSLAELIEIHKADMYIELREARECLKEIHEEEERSRIERTTKVKKQLALQYQRITEREQYRDSERDDDLQAEENRLLELVLLAEQDTTEEASDVLIAARALLDSKSQDRVLRMQLAETLGKQLDEAIATKDYEQLKVLIAEAEDTPSLLDRVQRGRDVLASGMLSVDIKHERIELSKFLEKALEFKTDTVAAFLSDSSKKDVMEDFELVDELDELIEKQDLEKVKIFLRNRENELSATSVEKARQFIQKAEEKSVSGPDDERFVSFSKHPLISSLHVTIIKLLRSCSVEDVDNIAAKHVVDSHNLHAQTIVRNITTLLSSNTRKMYFFKARTPWDIFKSLQVGAIQKIVSEFEACDVIQNLPAENHGTNLSLLFVQYLLDRDCFLYALQELLTNELYLSECYDKNSVFLSYQHQDDLLSVLDLLNQFQFNFGFSKYANSSSLQLTPDMIAAHPIIQVKTSVKAIIQLFYEKVKIEGHAMEEVGNERFTKEMGLLVRRKLCFALSELLQNGFKSKGFLSTYNIWNMFESAADLKRISVGDLGGIGVPVAVSTVNEVLEVRNQAGLTNEDDIKFRIFVCYALNDQQLSSMLLSILSEKTIIEEYYDASAAVRKPDILEKLHSFLKTLDSLPFDLELDAELL